jgi:hypothetical protein
MAKQTSSRTKTLKTIRAGGRPAVVSFLRSAYDRYASGGEGGLRTWPAVALAELPEEDQSELVAMLLGQVFDAEQSAQANKDR